MKKVGSYITFIIHVYRPVYSHFLPKNFVIMNNYHFFLFYKLNLIGRNMSLNYLTTKINYLFFSKAITINFGLTISQKRIR
jgi:hypothetical protein